MKGQVNFFHSLSRSVSLSLSRSVTHSVSVFLSKIFSAKGYEFMAIR